MYLGAGYAEILDFLCSPVAGFANVKVLVSQPGLGKTVLLRSAIERIKAEARTAFVFWTQFNPQDFVTDLLLEMGSDQPRPVHLSAAQDQFESLLRRAEADGKRFVIAIDDAHNLSYLKLRSLSALLDRDTARPPQATVLLAGLPGLHERLAHPEAIGIRNRISGVATIAPLNAEQTAEYIRARMSALAVGPFTPEQLTHVVASSGGVLRIIDKLCHQLLVEQGWKENTDHALIPDTLVNGSSDTTVHEGLDRVNESSMAADVYVERIAAWAIDRAGSWSGTLAELAAATGVSLKELSDAVENRTEELRKAGIATAIQRSPGKPRMITLSRVEREQAPDLPDATPELDESNSPLPKHEGQELETDAGVEQERASESRLDSTNEVGEPDPANRGATWASTAAKALAVITVAAAGVFYLSLPNSRHEASPVAQRVSEPKRSAEVDEIMGLQQRAEAGDPGSATALADRYREGNGVPRNDKAAMALYKEAAIKGDSVAQHRLGLALSSGSDGMAADRVAAYAWLVMAGSRGQPVDQATLDLLTRSLTRNQIVDVRYRLGVMYEHGIGCAPDLVFADEWFLLAAALGDARSRAESAALERRMSPAQISQAHARADDWLRRHTTKPTSNAALR